MPHMTPRQTVEFYSQHDDGKTPHPCPHCKIGVLALTEATVMIDYPGAYHVRGTPIEQRPREIVAVACNACEFITEARL